MERAKSSYAYAYYAYDTNSDSEYEFDENRDSEDEDLVKLFTAIEGIESDTVEEVKNTTEATEATLGLNLDGSDQSDIDACLRLNKEKKEILRDMLKMINHDLETLESSSETQEETMKRIKDGSFNLQNLHFNLDGLRKYGSPYFKDSKHFPCPRNQDMLTKTQRQEVDLALLPPLVKWQRWEMKLLDDAAHNVAVQKLLRPLHARRDRLEEQLRTQERLGHPTKQTLESLKQLGDEISEQLGSPLFEILHDPDADLDWMKISATDFDGRRSTNECRAMWRTCLMPGLKRENWKTQEINVLKEIASKHNHQNWEEIAEELGGGRSAFQCYIHMQVTLNRQRMKWTTIDDKKLIAAINTHRQGSYIPFGKVAKQLPGRTSQQVRQRWTQTLDPSIRSGAFTLKEDLILATARHAHELSFRQILCLLPGRTASQLRMRYNRLQNVKPSMPWTPEEDQKLLKLVKERGKWWSQMTTEFPQRDRQQLRGRYERIIKNVDSKSKLVTFNAVRKGSVWRTLKDNVDAKDTYRAISVSDLSSFVRMVGHNEKAPRKNKKRDHLDLEIANMFRSHFAQPKGRKKKHYSTEDLKTMRNEGRQISELLGVNYDWSKQSNLENKVDVDKGLVLMFEQLKGLHTEEQWDSARPRVELLMPPSVTSLVGLRTLLLEERSVMAQCMRNPPPQSTPTEPSLGAPNTTLATKSTNRRTTKNSSLLEMDTSVPALTQPSTSKAQTGAAATMQYDSIAGCSKETEARKQHLDPETAARLWKERFLSLFLWPTVMSQQSPPNNYRKDLFGGERMARVSSDEESSCEQSVDERPAKQARKKASGDPPANLPVNLSESIPNNQPDDSDDNGPEKPRMTKTRRKRWLKAHWLKFREEKQALYLKTKNGEEETRENNAEENSPVKAKRGRPAKSTEPNKGTVAIKKKLLPAEVGETSMTRSRSRPDTALPSLD